MNRRDCAVACVRAQTTAILPDVSTPLSPDDRAPAAPVALTTPPPALDSFANQDFSGHDFSRRDLRGADFRGSILVGTNFTGAHLDDARFDDAECWRAVFAEVHAPGVILRNTRMQESVWTGAHLPRADLSGAMADDAIFEHACLNQAVMRRTSFNRVRAGRLQCAGAITSDLQAKGAILWGATMSDTTHGPAKLAKARFDGANLWQAMLAGTYCADVELGGATLIGADLSGANLSNATMVGADCTDADLSHTTCLGTHFEGAILANAILTGAHLENANFSPAGYKKPGTDLDGADLRETFIRNTALGGADITDDTRFDDSHQERVEWDEPGDGYSL